MGETVAPLNASAARKAVRRPAVRQWARRHPFAAFITCLVLLALTFRLGWGWYLSRRLAARLDDVRSAGQATTLADVAIEPVADADNAWLAFSRAGAALAPGVDSPRNGMSEFPTYPPYGDAWHKAADASEKANARAFQLARGARTLPKAQLRSGGVGIAAALSVRYGASRSLANTLADGAMHAHLRGDDAEAVERLLDVMHLARTIRQDPALVSLLVALGIEALALDTSQQIAPTLSVKPQGGTSGGAASAAQVRTLIDTLLHERDVHESNVRSFAAERAFVLDAVDEESAATWAIRPLATRTKLRWLDGFDLLVEAAAKPNYAAARTLLARLDADWEPSRHARIIGGASPTMAPRYSRWFEDGGPQTFGQMLEHHFRLIAERRVVAVALAARLYRVDRGSWPAELALLVPDHLPAVPADPFFDDGRPLGYVVQRGVLPDGGDRPLVYFDVAGPAGPAVQFDDGIDAEPMFGWQSVRSTRQYRDLNLWLPTTRRFHEEQKKLRAEAVDADPEQPDTPGDEQQAEPQPDAPADQ